MHDIVIRGGTIIDGLGQRARLRVRILVPKFFTAS